jgi:hypothetical protein
MDDGGISFPFAMRPSIDDTAGQIREKWLNLKWKQRRICAAPAFPQKCCEFLRIEQKLLKKIQAFELLHIVKFIHDAITSESNPAVKRDRIN